MKIIITFICIILIVAIAIWFMTGHDDQEKAKISGKKQFQKVIVKGGYAPNVIVLKKGIPAELDFDLQDSTACLSSIAFDELGINQELHPGKNVISVPTDKAQELGFACGMNMFHGKVIIK
ncbi:MAG: cupredoxin domain-containing protein [Lactobacillus sp.]|nr:cupredoxin domain-containing protein [Lactobacillus sp.]